MKLNGREHTGILSWDAPPPRRRLRLGDKRASEGHPLLLAARELRGPPLRVSVHGHQGEQAPRPVVALRAGDTAHLVPAGILRSIASTATVLPYRLVTRISSSEA